MVLLVCDKGEQGAALWLSADPSAISPSLEGRLAGPPRHPSLYEPEVSLW